MTSLREILSRLGHDWDVANPDGHHGVSCRLASRYWNGIHLSRNAVVIGSHIHEVVDGKITPEPIHRIVRTLYADAQHIARLEEVSDATGMIADYDGDPEKIARYARDRVESLQAQGDIDGPIGHWLVRMHTAEGVEVEVYEADELLDMSDDADALAASA